MAVVLCPSCGRECQGNPNERVKCPQCWGWIFPHDRRQGLVRGTTLNNGHMIIEEQIGRGGFAITYRVTMDWGGQRVVKEYFPNGIAEDRRQPGTNMIVTRPDRQYQFATHADAFLLEARHLHGLQEVKGVVPFYDHFKDNDTWYIAMQAIEGTDLSRYVAQHGHLQLDDAVGIIRQVLKIMQHVYRIPPMDGMHAAGEYCLIHRDLSLGNVIRGSDGNVTIIDFGSARFMYEQLDKSIKAHYTPVEQLVNHTDQGQYTDLYAIGKMLYFMLAGAWPQNISNNDWISKQAKFELPPLRETHPELPAHVDEIIRKATAYDFHDRYQTADEFLEALNKLGKGGKKLPLPVLIGAGAIAVGALVAVLASGGGGGGEGNVETSAPTSTPTPTRQVIVTTAAPTQPPVRSYASAVQGAALYTDQDYDTAVKLLAKPVMVYVVAEEDGWVQILINESGSSSMYYVRDTVLTRLSYEESEAFEASAQENDGVIVVENGHLLLPAEATVIATRTPEPTPTQTVTATPSPTPTPPPFNIWVSFVDPDGVERYQDYYAVNWGEDLTIPAGVLTGNADYHVIGEQRIALTWQEDGKPKPDSAEIPCQPTPGPEATPTPPPASIQVRYVKENGEVLYQEQVEVPFGENYFSIKSQVKAYDVQRDGALEIIRWDVNGAPEKTEYVYVCVPSPTPAPTSTPVPQVQLAPFDVQKIELVYGKPGEFKLPFLYLQNNEVPQLSIDKDNANVRVSQHGTTLKLTPVHVGKSTLTVNDGLSVQTLEIEIISAVRSLNEQGVVLGLDGEPAVVGLTLEEGAVLDGNVRVYGLDGLRVTCSDNRLYITADRAVNGTASITVGGGTFDLNVRSAVALDGAKVYLAEREDLGDASAWKLLDTLDAGSEAGFAFDAGTARNGVLVIRPVMKQGRISYLEIEGEDVYRRDDDDICYVALSHAQWQKTGRGVTLRGDAGEIRVVVYTGEQILNLAEVKAALEAPLASGSTAEAPLVMFQGVSVENCSVSDPAVARAEIRNGRLVVEGADSGDAEISLTLTGTGGTVKIPVSVRQALKGLECSASDAFIGETVKVTLDTAGRASVEELQAEVTGDAYTLVQQDGNSLTLRAEKLGTAVLTVYDSFGGKHEKTLMVEPAMLGLSEKSLTIADGSRKRVKIHLAEGAAIPADLTITSDCEELVCRRNGSVIEAEVPAGKYAQGVVTVSAEGREYQFAVTTVDRLTGVTLYRVHKNELSDRKKWVQLKSADVVLNAEEKEDHYLVIVPQTLSGSAQGCVLTGYTFREELGGYMVDLELSRWEDAATAPLKLVLGESSRSVSIYTGDLIVNLPEVRAALEKPLKGGETLELPLKLHADVSVTGCTSGDKAVADVSYSNGRLRVKGKNSGSTVISLNLAPSGRVIEVPVSIRQEMSGLSKNRTDVICRGDQVTVTVSANGVPLQDEYDVTASNSNFNILRQNGNMITLQAEKVGSTELTVKDQFGNSRKLTLQVESAVTGIDRQSVTLKAGKSTKVLIQSRNGKTFPSDIMVESTDPLIRAERHGNRIDISVPEGKYASGTVKVTADGITYNVKVETIDEFHGMTVYQAPATDVENKNKWRRLAEVTPGQQEDWQFIFSSAEAASDVLIVVPRTLKGDAQSVQLSGKATYRKSINGYVISLKDAAWKSSTASAVVGEMSGEKAQFSIYTGSLLSNADAVKQALSKTVAGGENVPVSLELHSGASFTYRSEDPSIARVVSNGNKLYITGVNSGETNVTVTLKPTGETVEFPVRVRQRLDGITGGSSVVYLGDKITLGFTSKGKPLQDEFVCEPVGDYFELTRGEDGSSATLTARKVGTCILTVTDAFGNEKIITRTARSVVTGLSKNEVELTDGKTQTVVLQLASGKQLTDDIVIDEQLQGLTVKRIGSTIHLALDSGKYVAGTVTIYADGQPHELKVSTKDRLLDASVAYPTVTAANYRDLMRKGTVYVDVKTLSGEADKVEVDAAWKIAKRNGNRLTLEYQRAVANLADQQTISLSLNGSAKELKVDYDNIVLTDLNRLDPLKYGAEVKLSPDKTSKEVKNGSAVYIETLFNSFEGIDVRTSDGLEVKKENKLITLKAEDISQQYLYLTDEAGRETSLLVTVYPYLSGVEIDGVSTDVGQSCTIDLIEGDKITVRLQTEGGSAERLYDLNPWSSSGCVKVSKSGSTVAIQAMTPGSSTVTIGDHYGEVSLEVNVAQAWRFPNDSTTKEEIVQVTNMLKMMGYLKGRGVFSNWEDATVQNAVLAWKNAKGYPAGTTLNSTEYAQLKAEGDIAMGNATATATPVPAVKRVRTGQTARLTDVAAGADYVYLLDNEGWVLVMDLNGKVKEAFPAQDEAPYRKLYDTGDVPLAMDDMQAYALHTSSLEDVVKMYTHRNSPTGHLYNIASGIDSVQNGHTAAMSENGFIMVLGKSQKVSSGSKTVNMRQNQVVYAVRGGNVAPMYTNMAKTDLMSNVTAVAVDDQTFAMANKYQLYLFGEESALTRACKLQMGKEPKALRRTVNGRTLQGTVEQIVMTDRVIAIRMDDGKVYVAGENTYGQVGKLVRQDDSFVLCDIADDVVDMAVTDDSLYLLTEKGAVYVQGRGSHDKCTRVLTGIAAITANDDYAFAISDYGVYRLEGNEDTRLAESLKLP